MSKLGRKFLATALCTTMLASSSFAVFAADATTPGTGNVVTGDNKVEDPIYSVTVPTTLDFAVDAFEQNGQGQIVSSDISCTNNSNVAIKMNVAIKLTSAEGKDVTFATSADEVSTEEGTRSVFMQVQVAKTVTETKNAAAAYTTALVKDGDGNYYVSNDVAKTVTGDSGVTTSDANEMESVKLVAGTVGDEKVEFVLGTEDIELDFALAASDYVEYWATGTTKAKQFKTTAADNKSSACYTFTGKVNPNVVWAANDFKATATYTFMGMTASDYSNADIMENAHALIEKPVTPVDPTFASTAKGVITWSGDAGTGAVSEIVSIVATISGTEYDIFNETDGMWSAAEVDLENKKVTLDSGVATNLGMDVTVTITYKDSSAIPATKTAENVSVNVVD